ncbi:MAG: hypothetical protein ABTQ34_07575 [Bdellovibrionales bacterium]
MNTHRYARLATSALLFVLTVLPSSLVAEGKPQTLTSADVMSVVAREYIEATKISGWTPTAWGLADLDDDGVDDLVVFLRDRTAKPRGGIIYPAHVTIFEGVASSPRFDAIKGKHLVSLEDGQPSSAESGMTVSHDKKFLKSIGCEIPTAIEMIKKESTKFYLCWDGMRFGFHSAPSDNP